MLFRRLDVYAAMIGGGLVPLAHHPDLECAFALVKACADGGASLFEFTNRGVRTHDLFIRLAERCARELPRLMLGAGSIVDAPTAAAFIGAGASFVVGPTFDADTARLCNRQKIAYVPGCATATEIGRAEESGCEIVKLFPADAAGGPQFVTALKGPCPWTSLMATGGVTPDEANLRSWFGAGVACVGMGSALLSKEALAKQDWATITRDIATVVARIAKVRGG